MLKKKKQSVLCELISITVVSLWLRRAVAMTTWGLPTLIKYLLIRWWAVIS